MMEVLTRHGGASFLCVIKDCGPEGEGLLSFPRAGISIALDLAIRDQTQALVDALNQVVIEEGGRVYLAKDALSRPADFAAMDPRIAEFQRVRRAWDPEGKLRSAQSVRLLGDRP
jgi:FAD/FMN-containing dehydrogenase